ncbi:MAG: ferredoxin family protein [Phycisphaerae bacterium]|jgi:NAD-dependent dihydropyrimidine dehydrogenase PreA subunit|nr:ferredoxin family protein [Phycisphaerae bacterium]
MSTPLRILLCRCSQAHKVDQGASDQILRSLSKCESLVTVADDLCGLAAAGDPLLAEIAAAPRSAVIACHTRAIRWLFAAAGHPLDESRTSLYSLRRLNAQDILAALNAEPAPDGAENQIDTVVHDTDWPPWFPVIDRDRCVDCLQCLNFCLFGTFTLSPDKKAIVSKPAACKNLCPACARICPKSAIIFPKYDQAPIDGDDVPEDSNGPAVDLDALKRGDVYDRLRKRSAGQRFSPTRDDDATPPPVDPADRLGVPPEVLAAMSPDELRKICDRASQCQAPGCSCNTQSENNDEESNTDAD